MRSSTSPWRSRWTARTACCSTDFSGTKRIVGRATASQMRRWLSSLASFFPPRRYGSTNSAAMILGTWLSFSNRRAPVLSTGAGFHADHARWELRKKLEQLDASDRLAKHGLSDIVYAVHCKHTLCHVEADGSTRHGAFSSQGLDLNPPPIWRTRCHLSRGRPFHSFNTGRAGRRCSFSVSAGGGAPVNFDLGRRRGCADNYTP